MDTFEEVQDWINNVSVESGKRLRELWVPGNKEQLDVEIKAEYKEKIGKCSVSINFEVEIE